MKTLVDRYLDLRSRAAEGPYLAVADAEGRVIYSASRDGNVKLNDQSLAFIECWLNDKKMEATAELMAAAWNMTDLLRDQQARIGELIADIEHWKPEYRAWSEKTEWIQNEMNRGRLPARYLGKHRADVMLDMIVRMRGALSFYADPIRWFGPNQRNDNNDQWSGGSPYIHDATRDGGAIAREALDSDTTPPVQTETNFQARVQDWMLECFGDAIAQDRVERNHRFLEEALELVQSCGCTASEAHQLVDYVFSRPVGDPKQESGGVSVTHAALCLANGINMRIAAEVELARVWTKIEAIRAKQAAKPKHSPLPQLVQPPAPAVPTLVTEEWCTKMAELEAGHSVTAGCYAKPLADVCRLPPDGWICTREPGHDGPCAASFCAPPAPAVPDEWVRSELLPILEAAAGGALVSMAAGVALRSLKRMLAAVPEACRG